MSLESHAPFHASLAGNLIASAVVVTLLFLVRFFLEHRLQRKQHQFSHEELLRRLGNVRTFCSLILIPTLVYIWAAAVYALAVSLVVVAFACVVATKELILCFWGYVTLLRYRFYSLGNRVEIAGFRGDVIDIRWLSTTLLEVTPRREGDQRTGRRLCMPNSLLLSQPVYNESSLGPWSILMLRLVLPHKIDPLRAQELLLKAADDAVAPFLQRAQQELALLEARRRMALPPAQPKVYLELTSVEEYTLHISLPALVSDRERLETIIMERFLACLYSEGLCGVLAIP